MSYDAVTEKFHVELKGHLEGERDIQRIFIYFKVSYLLFII